MTTEILRSMLYKGAELIRDIEWVIFDEVSGWVDCALRCAAVAGRNTHPAKRRKVGLRIVLRVAKLGGGIKNRSQGAHIWKEGGHPAGAPGMPGGVSGAPPMGCDGVCFPAAPGALRECLKYCASNRCTT